MSKKTGKNLRNDDVTIRDIRQPGWLWADRNLIKRDGDKLGPYGIAVYMAIAAHTNNEDQSAYPSISTIAKMIHCSIRQVHREIAKLEELGWIQVERRYNEEKGVHYSNLYYLLDDPQGGSDSQSLPGDSQSPGVVTPSQGGSDSQSHKLKPFNESHIEIESLKDNNPPSGDATASPPFSAHEEAGDSSPHKQQGTSQESLASSSPNGETPVTLDGWLNIVAGAANPVTALGNMAATILGLEADRTLYGRIGKIYKDTFHRDAAYMARQIWVLPAYNPIGDKLNYLSRMKGQENGARRRNPGKVGMEGSSDVSVYERAAARQAR